MSLEKNFQPESWAFQFAIERLFGFLIGVSGSVWAVLACACMLVSVKFYVAKRDVCAC